MRPRSRLGRIAPVLALSVATLAAGCHGRGKARALEHAGSAEDGDDPDDEHGATKNADRGAEVIEFDLSGGVPESQVGGFLLPVPASRTYAGLVRELERASKRKHAEGFLLRLGSGSIGWAHGEELGLAFGRLREQSGKPIVCHAHALDNRATWFLARACTKVWVSPAGDVDTVGIGAESVYLKGALDKLKVRADFLHMGRYKSAAETLTQEGPSPEARESLTAVLASIRGTWLEGTTKARTAADLGRAMEDGPWSPEAAKAHGLVDAVGYESDARKDAETLAHASRTVSVFGGKKKDDGGFDVGELVRLIAGDEGPTRRPHVSIVPAEGSIAMSSGGMLSEGGITEKALRRVIRRLAGDDAVKAVVLRIDSPGGSALASDLLWHELMELRAKKPLVASVGDMAASGGYYLACAANKVVAPRTSIVGSIGVVGGKIVLGEALEELGVHAETFAASSAPGAGSRASYLSVLTPWDDATRERVREQMSSVYDLFVSRVAEGRGMQPAAVRAVAEGRIWSGSQAQKLGLVDELGGLGRALELARELAKLDADAPVRVEGGGDTVLESLLLGEGADQATVEAAFARATARRRTSLIERVAAPLRPFVSALEPLVSGETVATAMPVAVVLE